MSEHFEVHRGLARWHHANRQFKFQLHEQHFELQAPVSLLAKDKSHGTENMVDRSCRRERGKSSQKAFSGTWGVLMSRCKQSIH